MGWLASEAARLGAGPDALLNVAARVAAEGRLPEPAITEAARAAAPALAEVEPERVRAGIEGVIMGRGLDLGLQWMHEAGILKAILPELEATVDFSQEAGRRHKDVWEHTKQVVWQSVPKPAVRWAALLHDIGKVPTRVLLPDGRVTFHRHAEVGARMFNPIAKRYGFDRDGRQKVRFLILHHLRPNQYDPSWTDSAVRRFDRELQAHLTDLLDLSRADITSARPGKRQNALRNISELSARIQKLREEDAKVPPLPTGIGNVIMEHFQLPPSRQIGDLKRQLEVAVETGELESRREAEYYLAHVAKLLGRGQP